MLFHFCYTFVLFNALKTSAWLSAGCFSPNLNCVFKLDFVIFKKDLVFSSLAIKNVNIIQQCLF